MKLSFVYKVLGIDSEDEEGECNRAVIDSRQVKENDLFFALAGEHQDGHDFVASALEKGAIRAVISRPEYQNQCTILVENTLDALQTMAAAWKAELNPFTLAITGSSGKTTVKELAYNVLSHAFGKEHILATAGNLNNHLGVPLTLLALKGSHQFAVIEMGMNHFGELYVLSTLTQPDVALVNNVLRAHIGCGFSGIEDIARAKAEIFLGLKKEGTAVLPFGSDFYPLLLKAALPHKTISFGRAKADIQGELIAQQADSSLIRVTTPKGTIKTWLPFVGEHQINNVLAVFALLMPIDNLNLETIAQGLEHYRAGKGRGEETRLQNNIILIDDSYNANPDAVEYALDALSQRPGKKLFIFGDMGELGDYSSPLHEEIGAYAKKVGIDYLLAVGTDSKQAVIAFGEGAFHVRDLSQLRTKITEYLPLVNTVLVKGSRFMHLEKVVDILKKDYAAC